MTKQVIPMYQQMEKTGTYASFQPIRMSQVQKWCHSRVQLKANSTVMMSELYDDYAQEHEKRGGRKELLIKRKTFANLLKTHLINTYKNQIAFVYIEAPAIQGIALKETASFMANTRREYETAQANTETISFAK